jgi:hypothetical protein
MAKNKVLLPASCRNMMRAICSTATEMTRTFKLSNKECTAIWHDQPLQVTEKRAEVLQSICVNELKYALPARLAKIMKDPEQAVRFALWVNSAALMLDNFRMVQGTERQSSFVNSYDPFFVHFWHLAATMNEVEKLLLQIHQFCPQFDETFFRGTRFLQDHQTDAPVVNRVPLSVDVMSLSPADEKVYKKLVRSNNEHY